jgi:hypothetical protein
MVPACDPDGRWRPSHRATTPIPGAIGHKSQERYHLAGTGMAVASIQTTGSGGWHWWQNHGPGPPVSTVESRHHNPRPQCEQGRIGSSPRSMPMGGHGASRSVDRSTAEITPIAVPPTSLPWDTGTASTGGVSRLLSCRLSRRKTSFSDALCLLVPVTVPPLVPRYSVPVADCPAVPNP